ncbi:MAG: Ig-like domain-containing protein [Prevotella sp.]|nr:Ig-like domain-containing protein [Staphylococcus sp.]MCM1350123.1 Ig-like domain-containing protein [Prevotella sp.]
MKSVKKIFFAFLVLFVGIVLLGSVSTAKASDPVATPWFITFDDGVVVNIREGELGFRKNANSFTISYFDASGKTEGGYFDLWAETRMIEQFIPFVNRVYLKNGEKMSFDMGGRMEFKYYQIGDEGYPVNPTTYQLYVNRSIENSNRIQTNVTEDKYYYDYVYFEDVDHIWDVDENLIWDIYNYDTGKEYEFNGYFNTYEEGEYYVTIYDIVTEESLNFEFVVDRTKPTIELIEWDWMTGTPLLGNHITSKGVKVNCSDEMELVSITYQYKGFHSMYLEERPMENGFTFYRKGDYKIIAVDAAGNQQVVSFIITDFDIMIDPENVYPVGTEVTKHGGERGGTTMSVGYTRCLYLGGNAPSQSRLDYTFTSSDETIATVSAYGTVEAKAAGTVVITCVNKKNPNLVSKVILTVLP